MKKLFSLIVCSVLLLGTYSCKNGDDDIFDQSSAERLSATIKEYQEYFADAPNGWVMEYFPRSTFDTFDEASKGYIYIVKFDKNGSVLMAAQNEYTDNVYKEDVSLWSVIGDNGPVLTFNSDNDIFHLFADPGSDGKGMEGDYEFTVMEPQNDVVIVKGKKSGAYVRFTKLKFEEGADEQAARKAYIQTVVDMNNLLFKNVPNGYDLVIGNERYTCTNGSTNIFSLLLEGADAISDTKYMPFVVTATGLKLYEPLNGAQEFVLNTEKTALECIGKTDAYIERELPANFFVRIISGGKSKWTLDSKQMGSKARTAYEKLEAALTVEGYKISNVTLTYDAIRESFVVSSVLKRNNANVTVLLDHTFASKENGSVVSIEYKNTFDSNGKHFYEGYPDFAKFMNLLNSQFKIDSANQNILNLSKIKIVNVDDPEIWFILGV